MESRVPGDMTSTDTVYDPPAWRDRLGASLLSICAVGAIVAAISAVATVSDAGSATEAVETWRMVGFAFFAGSASIQGDRDVRPAAPGTTSVIFHT